MNFKTSEPQETSQKAKGIGFFSSQVSALLSLMTEKQYYGIFADCRQNYSSAIFKCLI